jgi:drug/metabolite transporter (DMT)-like permease
MDSLSFVILMIATLISGIATILDKTLTQGKHVSHTTSTLSFALVRLPIVIVGFPLLSPVPSEVILLGSMSGVCYMLAVWRYFRLVALHPISELSPMFRWVTPQAWWLGILILGDQPGPYQQWATFLLICGGVLLTIRLTRAGLGLSVAALHMVPITVLLALEQTINAHISRLTTFWHAMYLDCTGYCVSLAVALSVATIFRGFTWQGTSKACWLILLGQQTTRLALSLAPIYVVSMGMPLGMASAISSISPLWVLVLAAIFLRERPSNGGDLTVKLVGIVIISVGIILMFS